jgi:hypothetical protein
MLLVEFVQFMMFLIAANIVLKFAAVRLADTRVGSALAFVA